MFTESNIHRQGVVLSQQDVHALLSTLWDVQLIAQCWCADHSNCRMAVEVFTLPPLGYDFDALEPEIDATTMQIHHE